MKDLQNLKIIFLVFEHISGHNNMSQNQIARLASMLKCKFSKWPLTYLGFLLRGI